MANTTFTLRANNTSGIVPTSGQLGFGELAINLGDGKLFSKMANGTVINLNPAGGGGGGTPGGTPGAVQYNTGSAFGGDSGFTYDTGANKLALLDSTIVIDSSISGVANVTFDYSGITIDGNSTVSSVVYNYVDVPTRGKALALIGTHTY